MGDHPKGDLDQTQDGAEQHPPVLHWREQPFWEVLRMLQAEPGDPVPNTMETAEELLQTCRMGMEDAGLLIIQNAI
jgi:hypothetical protein